jgi:hypothetical protein
MIRTVMKFQLLFMLLLAGAGLAQDLPKKPVVEVRVKALAGKIVSVNPKLRTLVIRIGNLDQEVRCPLDCRLGDEQDELNALDELKIGEGVYANCINQNGLLLANRLARIKPHPAKVKPPAAKKAPR